MNTRKKRKLKIHTGSVSKIALFTALFQDKAEKKIVQSMPCGYSKLVSQVAQRCKRLEMNLITLGWENFQKLPKIAKLEIGRFLPVFGRFLCLGWFNWFLVFCILSGSLRHNFRVPTRHTLMKHFFRLYLENWPKERNFGKTSSVNFDFMFFFVLI